MSYHLPLALATLVFFLPLLKASPALTSADSCRCLPGDDCWPSPQDWAQLNITVHGRLIATIPLGAPCHNPIYNATECSLLQIEWPHPEIHFSSSSSVMAPYFQSCDPYTPKTTPCTLGDYIDYSINVTSAEDVVAGLKFGQENNIRVVIRNTGHDYLGKSTGKGALGIWTHSLKSIDFIYYESEHYNGPAIKMGAGVEVFEAYYAANSRGLRVVGGDCPTVGLAGGYSQGGGHSILSSTYGLGADQTLEWEVVTADGKLVTASPTENSDLYWALSGGGGGTYGLVLSLTSKAHPDGEIGGASLAFNLAGISPDTYWDAISLWHENLPKIVDSGAQAIYTILNESFILNCLTWPGSSVSQVSALLQPFTTGLEERNITYSLNVTSFPSFVKHFNHFLGPLPFGPPMANTDQVTGGRLVPRSVVYTNNSALTAALRNISSSGNFYFNLFGVNVSHALVGNTPSSNAVLPAWRDALVSIVVVGPWDFTVPREEMVEREDELTNSVMPQLEAVTPGSGAYLNEANFQQRNWQEDFYGSNYEKLRSVKKKYDPSDLFYATTAVGSEAWTVASDGRLCRS